MLRKGIMLLLLVLVLRPEVGAQEFSPMRSFKEYDPIRLKGFDAMPAFPQEKFGAFATIPSPSEVKLSVPDQKYSGYKELQAPKVNLPPYVDPRYQGYSGYKSITQTPFKSLPEPKFRPYATFAPFRK